MKPQVALLLSELEARGEAGITSLEAQAAGIGSRLAARVSDLRAEGYDVSSELVRVETRDGTARVARYVLHEEPVQLTWFSRDVPQASSSPRAGLPSAAARI